MKRDQTADRLTAVIAGLLPDLETFYKDLHAHPELSMRETRTAALAADRLRANGFDVTDRVGKTGVVGLLRNGDGPVVMLRADMDALPVKEETGLPLVVVIGYLLGTAPTGAAVLGAALCFCLRLFAIRRGWQLPVARPGPDEK